MKLIKSYLTVFYFIVLTISFSFIKCGENPPQLSPEVCRVGTMICDISQNICSSFPIPSQVCNYLDLACVNINVLCNSTPGSPAYKQAEKNLQENSDMINESIQKYKKLFPEILDSLKELNQYKE